jgi:hypothetical protein
MGGAADTVDAGYRRVLVAPGIEIPRIHWRFPADLQTPVCQDVNSP